MTNAANEAPDYGWERSSYAAVRAHSDDATPNGAILLNALVEQRARHGWPIESWMPLRRADGSLMTTEERDRRLTDVRVQQERSVAEHRAQEPNCELCVAEDERRHHWRRISG